MNSVNFVMVFDIVFVQKTNIILSSIIIDC
jgi:hypothetical protein